MELTRGTYHSRKEEAIESAVLQAAVLFNHFGWKVWNGKDKLTTPGDWRLREIITEIVESAEEAFNKAKDDYPVRVGSARISATIWPFDDSVAYMIDFELAEWDDSEGEDDSLAWEENDEKSRSD